MECRVETKESFISVLFQWWKGHGFPQLPVDALPKRIFVVANKGVDLYAIPVYTTDSNICWMGFTTSNPEATKEQKKGALKFLLETAEDIMSGLGFSLMVTTSDTPPLMECYSEGGYDLAEENVNFYIKKIWEQV